MKILEKQVIAIILIMCLLFSEFAALISYALESDDLKTENVISLVEDYKSKLYENYFSDTTNEFKYVTKKNISISYDDNITSVLLEDENDAFSFNDEKIYLEDSVYYNAIYISIKSFDDILGENGEISLYDNEKNIIGKITSDSEKSGDDYYVFKFKKLYENISYEITPVLKEGNLEIINQKSIKSDITEKIDYETMREIKEITTNTKLTYLYDAESNKKEEVENFPQIVKLKEPITDIDLSVNENSIYTLEENKIDFTLVLKNSSYENELYENPVIQIELPEEITEATIDKVMLLYKNGLSISKWDVIENENSRKCLYLELEGKQTEYQKSTIIDGTNVIIETTLKIDETTPIKSSNIKFRYENSGKSIKYIEEGKDAEELEIQFMSKYGLLTLNGIENLSKENEKELSIGETIKTIDLDIESEAQTLNHDMAIVNNYIESLENVEIIGNFSAENNEKLLEEDLKNTFTSTLLTTIGTQGVENTIYYSNETNPTSDSQTWTKNYQELENISSYKIVIGSFGSGEILKFNYQTETPENLTNNQSIYFDYYVNYFYDGQNQTVASIVGAKTEEKEVIFEECQVKEENELSVGIFTSKGGKALAEGQEVHEGQIIKYSVVLTNNTKNDIENISINTELENGNFWELMKIENSPTFMDVTEYTEYRENTDKKLDTKTIDILKPGEEIQIIIEAIIRKNNDSDFIKGNFEITADNIEKLSVNSISNKIKNSKLNNIISYGGTENQELYTTASLKLLDYVTNNTENQIECVWLELFCPVNYKYDTEIIKSFNENVEIYSEEITSDRKKVVFKISNILPWETRMVFVQGEAEKLPLEQSDETYSFYSIAYMNETEDKYYSNDYTRVFYQSETELEVNLNTENNNKELYNNDEIEFIMEISNIGYIKTFPNVKFNVPKGMDILSYVIEKNDEVIEESQEKCDYFEKDIILEPEEKVTIKLKFIVDTEELEVEETEVELFGEIIGLNFDRKVTDIKNYTIVKEDAKIDGVVEDEEFIDENLDYTYEEYPENDDSSEGDNDSEDNTDSENSDNSDNNTDLDNNDQEQDENIKDDENLVPDQEEDKIHQGSNNDDDTVITKDEILTDSNKENTEKIEETYSVSGMVWLDKDKDGLKTETELNMKDIIVKLYSVNSNNELYKNEISSTKTNNDGKYIFKNIPEGEYIIVFEYDTELYSITKYNQKSVDKENSIVISKNIDNKDVAVSNILTIEKNDVKSINLGLVSNSSFDLKIDKYISSVTVQNQKDNRTNYYNKEKIIKEEISAKYLEGTKITINYNIEISNIGEISGYANKIVDYLPEGLEFDQNSNKDWYLVDGVLNNTSLSNIELKPGEKKEFKLVLTKILTEKDLGTLTNKAEITVNSNSKNIEDTDISNNTSEMKLVLSISTGRIIVISILIFLVIISVVTFYFIKLKKNKK